MPWVSGNSKSRAKRIRSGRRTKSTKKNRYTVTVPKSITGGFAPRLKCNLVYCDVYGATAATGSDIRQYNLNSIFDPDRSGTGHQPMGHDQLGQIYNRYRVNSCTVTVHWTLTGANGAVMALLGNNTTSGFTNYTDMLEQQDCKSRAIIEFTPGAKIRKKYYLPKILGVTKTEYSGSDRHQAIFGATPTELAILHVGTADTRSASFTYAYFIKMVYNCEFFDTIEVAQS